MNISYLVRNEKSKKVYTVQVLKEFGFILAAINFTYVDDSLVTIEFNSYKYGITRYSLEEKKFNGSLWESESDAQSISNLNYHYTSIGLGSTATNSESDLKIVNSVVEIIKNPELNTLLSNVIDKSENTGNQIEEFFLDRCF